MINLNIDEWAIITPIIKEKNIDMQNIYNKFLKNYNQTIKIINKSNFDKKLISWNFISYTIC